MNDIKVMDSGNGYDLESAAPALVRYKAETEGSCGGDGRAETAAAAGYGSRRLSQETAYTEDEWIEPVWGRTQADADRARYLNDKIAAGGLGSLTQEEQTQWLSGLLGCLNYDDLNRIEADTRWLSQTLHAYGYGLAGLEHKMDWGMTDLPMISAMERIRTNVQHLIDIYHGQSAQLPAALSSPGWQEINDVERILYEMRDMIDRMAESFLYCGAAACGQAAGL